MESLTELIAQVRNDPQCQSNINIQEILMQNEDTHYLQNQNLNTIIQHSMQIINHHFPNTVSSNIEVISKLKEYRTIESINDLHKGKHTRWIRLSEGESKLTNGGMLMDIKFLDNGIHLLCKTKTNRFIQYKYDDCLTFQKLNEDELTILGLQGILS